MSITSPAADVDIANLALSHLQSRANITDLDEVNSKAARHIKLHYAQTRDELLRSYKWNFATGWEAMARLSEAPVAEWLYAYQIPGSALRVLEVSGLASDEWEVGSDRRLLCNASSLVKAKMVFRVSDVSKYDPLFISMFAMTLAVKVGPVLTRHRSVVDSVKSDLLTVSAKAQTIDAFERREPASDHVPAYIAARII